MTKQEWEISVRYPNVERSLAYGRLTRGGRAIVPCGLPAWDGKILRFPTKREAQTHMKMLARQEKRGRMYRVVKAVSV